MDSELADALRPVFLEPRDDYWQIHDPERLSMEDQRGYRLTPRGTADVLKNAYYCEDCFPKAAARESR